MGEYLSIGSDGPLGLITLRRPQVINALDAGMVENITATLERWQSDEAVTAVLFQGEGSRGFCSGGDVRAMRELVLSGRAEEADAFFAAEYGMNWLIATYRKPTIALMHGASMGGGLGIAGHCRFRFAADGVRLAMPESAIGFVSDVGVHWILARALLHRALLFLLSGLPVGGADGLALGLCDCVVPQPRLQELPTVLSVAARSHDPGTALAARMMAESIHPGTPTLVPLADMLASELSGGDAGVIVAAVEARSQIDPVFEQLAKTIRSRSPSSLQAILAGHLAARHAANVRDVLAMDLRLARHMLRQPDFTEGVRAVLVDKDGRANWSPPDFGSRPAGAIADAVRGDREPGGMP